MPDTQSQISQRITFFYLPALTVAIPGAAYLASLPQTLYWGDGIELAGAGRVLGVAHPTGYPLYTLMLHAAQCLPLGTVAFRSNLLSAALAVLAALVWYFVALKIMKRLPSQYFRNELRQGAVAATVAVSLALSRTYWFHAVNTQTCALHMLFMASGAWICLAMMERFSFRLWAMAWLLFGLALAHHRLSLALGPMILIGAAGGFFKRNRSQKQTKGANDARSALPRLSGKRAIKALTIASLMLALGLSAYIYMPIRAAKNPPQNWGDPTSLSRFLWSVRGGQFVDFMLLHYDPARSFTARTYPPWAYQRAKHLFHWALAQTGWSDPSRPPVTPVGSLKPTWGEARARTIRFLAVVALWHMIGLGVVKWFRNDRWAAAMAAAFCAVNLAVVFAYNIPDIHDYFEPLFPWIALAAALGWVEAANWIEKRYWGAAYIAGPAFVGPWALCMLAPLFMLLVNLADLGHLKNPAAQEYGRRLLADAEPNALVLTQGDSDIYSLWYQQNVEHYRTDVTVFGANFIAGSPWYREYFRGRHPFAMDFPFADTVLPGEKAYYDLWANQIIAPQLKTGRAIYTTFNSPFLSPFDVQPAMTLLANEDHDCPEGMPISIPIGQDDYRLDIFYSQVAEGGLIPRPLLAMRVKLRK